MLMDKKKTFDDIPENCNLESISTDETSSNDNSKLISKSIKTSNEQLERLHLSKEKAGYKSLSTFFDALLMCYEETHFISHDSTNDEKINTLVTYLDSIRHLFVTEIDEKESLRSTLHDKYEDIVKQKSATIAELTKKNATYEKDIKELKPKADLADSLNQKLISSLNRLEILEKRDVELNQELATFRKDYIKTIELKNQIKLLESQLANSKEMIEFLKNK